MIFLEVVDGIGKAGDLSLEMIASKNPRLMYPPTKVKIVGLDPKTQYSMSLKLKRYPSRLELRGTRWTAVADDMSFDTDELNNFVFWDAIYPSQKDRSGSFFMKNGVNFEKARISFNRHEAKKNDDTLFVRKYFEYHQYLCIDMVVPGTAEKAPALIKVGEFKLDGTQFIATSHFESTRMCQFYAIAFENLRTEKWEPRPPRQRQRAAPKQKKSRAFVGARAPARPRLLLKSADYSKIFKTPRALNSTHHATQQPDASQ